MGLFDKLFGGGKKAKRSKETVQTRGVHMPDLKIPVDMYPDWVDSLLKTVEEHDDEFSPAVGEAWRTTIAPAIAYMQGHA